MGDQVPDGIEAEAVTSWLRERVPELDAPLSFEMIEGGRSNLTYHVRDAAGRRWVLRRPPLHSVLKSAHDVAREARIMRALAPTDVPVPPVIGIEESPAVNGAPFFVMEHVDGLVLRDERAGREDIDEAGRIAVTDHLVDVLGRLHAVDPDDVGMGDFAKKEDYIARQLHRWRGQLEKGSSRELPQLHSVHDRLVESIPDQGDATFVHGDYRLDNLIVSPAGEVRAVLDWELCTLGDPLADVGMLLVYWAEPDDITIPLVSSPTVAPGFPGRDAVAQRYAEVTGRDLAQIDYYMAFAFWRIAIILEGVYSRFAAGAYGDTDDSFKAFGDAVIALGDKAAEALDGAGT